MQDTQLLLLPVRLRKKHAQRENQCPLRAATSGTCSRDTSQQIWKPAGCHSLHTNGVEGVHLHHPFARSPSPARKSCSSSVYSLSSNKENESDSLRTSRIFKQKKFHTLPLRTNILQQEAGTQHHLSNTQGGSSALSSPHSLCSNDTISCKGVLQSTIGCRPVLKAISNTCSTGPCSGILHSTRNTSAQKHTCSTGHHLKTTPRSSSHFSDTQEPSSTISCGSNSSCSGYTPGTRGAPTPEYVSPLRSVTTARDTAGQQQSSRRQEVCGSHLHAGARELEQDTTSSGSNAALYSSYHMQESCQPQHAHVFHSHGQRQCAVQQPKQRSHMVERASSPIQFLGGLTAADNVQPYCSAVAPAQRAKLNSNAGAMHHQQFIPSDCQQQQDITALRLEISSTIMTLPAQQDVPNAAGAVKQQVQDQQLGEVQHLRDQEIHTAWPHPVASQESSDECYMSLEDLEQQQRRHQWKIHQQQQQQQQHLDYLEHQRNSHDKQSSTAKGSIVPEEPPLQDPPEAAASPAAASPAAAAAASAVADYKRILGEAQAMAQKSVAAWAQLNSYHQQRVWGRIPGNSTNSSTGNRVTCQTPTPSLASRQLSRMGRVATATAASYPTAGKTATAQRVAVSNSPYKSLEAVPYSACSPDVFHTPTGELEHSGGRACPAPASSLREAAAASARCDAADLRSVVKYRDIPVLPGSPAALVVSLSRNGSHSSNDHIDVLCQGDNLIATRHQPVSADTAGATAAVLADATPSQVLLHSLNATRAAVRASIAASLRSSCEATPSIVPLVAVCSSPATQPIDVLGSGVSLDKNKSSTAAEPVDATSRDCTFRNCSPLPASPAWSMYLTPGTGVTGPTSSVSTRVSVADPCINGSLETRNAEAKQALFDTARSQDAWWRATGADISSGKQQHRSVADATTLQRLQGSYAASPATGMKPRDLSDWFEEAEQQPVGVAAAQAATAAYATGVSASSSIEGFPFTPSSSHGGSTRASCGALAAAQQLEQMIDQAAKGTEALEEGMPNISLSATHCRRGNASQPDDASSSDLDSDLEWLQKYLDAKALTAITPDSSNNSRYVERDPQQDNVGSQQSAILLEAAPAADIDQSSSRVLPNNDKEVWTVHNNWVATGMEAAADAVEAGSAPIALCSIANAAKGDATPQQNAIVCKEELENISSELQNLTYQQALAAYSQLASKVKQRIDETTDGLLAKLNLDTPVTAACEDGKDGISSSSASHSGSTTSGSVSAAVTCKQDVGMVVLSPHNACGRWQSSQTRCEHE